MYDDGQRVTLDDRVQWLTKEVSDVGGAVELLEQRIDERLQEVRHVAEQIRRHVSLISGCAVCGSILLVLLVVALWWRFW
jgi:energy-converting hydrogenase Eha subunit H